MRKVQSQHSELNEVVAAHGPWSAMAIHLGNGEYTKEDAPDFRLRRILQAAVDSVGKPLDKCRVLDLACLEGQYAIEFALHGAEAVGIELRTANVTKAAYAAKALGLNNATFYEDDVNNLSPDVYGTFDIIICSGILYHLRGEDAYSLIRKMRDCCTGITIVDTYIAAHPDKTMTINGKSVTGAVYTEHDTNTSREEKLADLWASVDNESSFWLSEESLTKAMIDAGFTSLNEVLLPFLSPSYDRRTYLAMCGTPVAVKSSQATQAAKEQEPFYRDPAKLHPSQVRRSAAFKVAKRVLPQGLKDMIKPTLRKIGVLDTKEAPEFLSDKKK
jgi:2-polyprenyl-3-methyl-5-hydroxy-6-metoxy-1,4-benzoquinol methylase